MKWLLALALVVSAPVMASPWAAPGDARLRSDVELLRAYGYIQGPSDAWPLPWAQINRGLALAETDGALAPHVRAATIRVRKLSDFYAQSSHFQARASVTNDSALVRGFDRTSRNRAEVSASASHNLGPLHVTWGGTWQSQGDPDQPAVRSKNGFSPDPTFVSLKVAHNWMVYGGYVDHYWGSGQDGAMIFSTSARPFPKIGIRRIEPYNFGTPLLSWMGPWTVEMFVGRANEQRDFNNPAMVGMRFAFQPTPHAQFGLNRGLQLCGEGRPCDLNTISKALVGFGDFDNTGTLEEPGNQLGGFDFSYNRPIGKSGQVLKLNLAVTAEDADNILIEQFARQVGVGISGRIGDKGAMHDSGIEYVDTQAAKFFGQLMGGETWPGSTYNHYFYYDGWTYGRRPIGHSLDGDARALTIYSALTDTENRRWSLSARHIVLNVNNVEKNRISTNRERILQLEGSVSAPTRFGDIKLTSRVQDNAPNTPDRNPLLVQGELSWTTRF